MKNLFFFTLLSIFFSTHLFSQDLQVQNYNPPIPYTGTTDWGNDYLGCDTNLNIGYGYNGTPNDGSGAGNTYGQFPPAFGFKVLKGPFDKITNVDQTFTSFSAIGRTHGPPCESNPNGEPLGAYRMMSGYKKDLTPWVNPLTGEPTKYVYPGDPEAGTGWTEFQGSIQNCNGQLTGNILPVNPPGSRKALFGNGKIIAAGLSKSTLFEYTVTCRLFINGATNILVELTSLALGIIIHIFTYFLFL